ncbi:hypothetical protein ACMGGR_11430 [Erwinia sp. BNK-24-b]|uniref:hypothetical protein n=1 Tax=unclassified Erwinia TaxID=2622719 RepID=UPI0039BF28AA
MSIFLKISVPMLCIAGVMFHLAYKRKNKNFLIPGFALLVSGLLNAGIGLTTG